MFFLGFHLVFLLNKCLNMPKKSTKKKPTSQDDFGWFGEGVDDFPRVNPG